MVKQSTLEKMFGGYIDVDPEETIYRVHKKSHKSLKVVREYYSLWRNYLLESNCLGKSIEVISKGEKIKLKGENGDYLVDKGGFTITHNNAYLYFQNRNDWEKFKKEIDAIFDFTNTKLDEVIC